MIDAYENYYKYKLSADPFRLSPDHRFAYSHPSYAKARAYLEFAIRRGEGFITITGGPGTGKTTLINEIVSSISDNTVLVATLSSTQLESRDLLHMVAASFGLRYGEVSKSTLLLGIEDFLTQQHRKNKRAVLIVDEAQGLSNGAIEELRLLANLQYQNRLLLQVVLVGQEQLRDIIKAPGMEHLSQRIIVASHLDPLSLADTVTYIEHRLTKVRWQGDPSISEAALRLVHEFSGGVPRRINLICSRLFLFGGLEGKHELSGDDALVVIEDLQKESLLPAQPPPPVVGENIGQEAEVTPASLSLPREHPVGEKPGQKTADEPAPAASAGSDQKKPSSTNEPEDILSSRAPLREALGQVCSTLEESEQSRPGRTRRPQARASATGAERSSKPVTEARSRPRAAVRISPDDVPRRARPSRNEKKPGKQRHLISVLVVASGLALAYSLVDRNGDDSPRDAALITNATDTAESPVTGSIPDNDTDLSASQPVQHEDNVSLSEPTELDASGLAPVSPVTQEIPETPAAEPPAIDERSPDVAGSVQTTAKIEPSSPQTASTSSVSGLNSAAGDSGTGQVTEDDARSPAPASGDAAPARTSSRDLSPAAIRPAPAPASSPGSDEKPAVAPASPSRADIEARREQLAREARERFSTQLARVETDSSNIKTEKSVTKPAPVREVTSPVTGSVPKPRASQPKTAPARVTPSQPKIAIATPRVAAVQPKPRIGDEQRIKDALLEGRWTSQGKPASLLPSDVTLCKDERPTIVCWSVPRNITTTFGEALYKVEATLQDFSASGEFEISYRTLVRLVGAATGGNSPADADKGDWQVSQHATSCRFMPPGSVSCRDEKGVVREYRR